MEGRILLTHTHTHTHWFTPHIRTRWRYTYTHLRPCSSLSLMWIDRPQSSCHCQCSQQRADNCLIWFGAQKTHTTHTCQSRRAAGEALVRQPLRLTVCFIWHAYKYEPPLPRTHGQPEEKACHLSGWKNDSESSNSKSLAALLDLPSLATMDLCWEAGGAGYKSVNNTQECAHTNFHKASKHNPPSPPHVT